ncbi:MAG: lipoyl(octanoyl) transferase LipB [Pseudomonadota bacterium]|nr:lipoyl(octanoyl) transferase LipB [Pseudomonadota bacterium]
MNIVELGTTEYQTAWEAMRDYTAARTADSADALWLTEHPPVFTLGQAGDPAHVLAAGDIPLVRSDRGGQVTYHGPGQIVVYVLVDLARRRFGVRPLVRLLEDAVVAVLARHGIAAAGRVDAPGVYVGAAKIASIGLRVRHGRSFHGLAFNADMDLEPFSRINPCGYQGLQVTDARRQGIPDSVPALRAQLAQEICARWQAAGSENIAADASAAVPLPTTAA